MKKTTIEPADGEGVALARWIKWVNLTPYLAGGFLAVIVAAYAIAFVQNGWSKNPDAWGQLGDYIGGLLNPLVAGFALMALVVSVRLQKAELAATREELKNSRLAMQEQATTAEQQRREQRFFDLLNLYQATLNSFTTEGSSGKAALNNWTKLSPHAKDCDDFVNHGWDEFAVYINVKDPSQGGVLVRKTVEKTVSEEQITSSWNNFSPLFDHYFRTIFSILGELEKLLGSDHWRYGKLFRAQLSRDELTLLAFNLLFDEEGKKMRPLVCKYGLLKHLAKTELRDHAVTQLEPAAFGLGWVKAQQQAATPIEAHPC